ncbi:MAG: ATPase P [Oscillospiraceae bacterium]|nr:ATPase P [Oscillospiraceae bacterium]
MLKPAQLGRESLSPEALSQDRKHCQKIGPCGVGEQALYLNSFYLDRRYYVPIASVSRVFKRVALSKGGFSGKGLFASIPYLVVVYDSGREKQCNFKFEEKVDQVIACVGQRHPEIKLVSAEVEKRLAKRERERARRKLPELSEAVLAERETLRRAALYLEKRPELTLELSQAARRKRAFLQSKPAYKWVALLIGLLGLAALVYGIWALLNHVEFAAYFTLFGLAAIFLFSSAGMFPTARNNRQSILARADHAKDAMEAYVGAYPDFPVPARYAHPVVLKRMIDILEGGRAQKITPALNVLKRDLQALHAGVEIDQDEHDEVMTIKALFLNEDYA